MNDEVKEKRPVFLYIICFVSVIANLISIIVLLMLLAGGKMTASLYKIPVIDIYSEELRYGTSLSYLIKIGIHVFCIFAVILISRNKRKGVVLYALGQLMLLAFPWLFLYNLGVNYLLISSLLSLIFSLFIIMLFAVSVTRKKVKQPS